MSHAFMSGYVLRQGSVLEQALLLRFMQQTYRELYPDADLGHLAYTVDHYFSKGTPLWWVDLDRGEVDALASSRPEPRRSPAGCLWIGNATDQSTGDRHAHIFLLYVQPQYRRQGIGTALMNYAESWAMQRGDRQIGLQVFQANQPALNLYRKLGYQTQSLWMVKPLV